MILTFLKLVKKKNLCINVFLLLYHVFVDKLPGERSPIKGRISKAKIKSIKMTLVVCLGMLYSARLLRGDPLNTIYFVYMLYFYDTTITTFFSCVTSNMLYHYLCQV
jgi:hypothetical protein